MRWLWFLLALVPTSLFGKSEKESVLFSPWVIYYGSTAPVESFTPFNPIILDSSYTSLLPSLRQEHKKVFAYLSIGEVAASRPYFKLLKEKKVVLHENPNWPDSYYIDVREETWIRLLLDHLIPEIIQAGFEGVFLDTVDSSLFLEESDPVTYKGTKKGVIQIIQLMRVYFPQLKIYINRGYDLLPDIGEAIHGVVAESLYTTYNFKHKLYEHFPMEQYESQTKKIHQLTAPFPHIQLFSLDYWYPDQIEEIEAIYAVERAHGFRPYVSVISLDRILEEPHSPMPQL